MQKEFQLLQKMIGALLGTREEKTLKTHIARARAAGQPYDAHRIQLFSELFTQLKNNPLPVRQNLNVTTQQLQNCAFFEAYFSNYIEGTEFVVEEAEEIIFKNKIMSQRSADAHDISSTYQIVSNTQEMSTVPKSVEMLIDYYKNAMLY